jgi:hypothetical protein
VQDRPAAGDWPSPAKRMAKGACRIRSWRGWRAGMVVAHGADHQHRWPDMRISPDNEAVLSGPSMHLVPQETKAHASQYLPPITGTHPALLPPPPVQCPLIPRRKTPYMPDRDSTGPAHRGTARAKR